MKRITIMALAVTALAQIPRTLAAAELVQPEHIYQYNGECSFNKSDQYPCILRDFHYPNFLRKLEFIGPISSIAYTGYNDPGSTPGTKFGVRELMWNKLTHSIFGDHNNTTGYCDISLTAELPSTINCSARITYSPSSHTTISLYITNITD